MAKSVAKKLNEASELAAILGLKNSDCEAVSVYDFHDGAVFWIRLDSFSNLVGKLKLHRSKIQHRADGSKVQFWFMHRGCKFYCMVAVSEVQEVIAAINGQSPERLDAPKRRGLPSPRTGQLLLPQKGT